MQAGLRHVDDGRPGVRRVRAGIGFRYLDADGRPVRDPDELERIRGLAIPPAWTDVWICADSRGHLQATGRDARGRKQYRYHPEWARVRGQGKFDRVVAFGAGLPRLRRHLRDDLRQPGLSRTRVVAIVVALMADTLARVGNDAYARHNRSYGLTTLRNRHIAFLRGGRARLDFRGKGGARVQIAVDDARLVALARRCRELPGQALFQYLDAEGASVPVGSADVNEYLRAAMDGPFTAKDFRTWGGTLEAFRALARMPVPEAAVARAAVRAEVATQVAQRLGNTPAVCRKAYIDPLVFEAWEEGRLARAARDCRGPRQWEQACLAVLRRAHRGPASGRHRGSAAG